jgi:glycosyltransferase involved in cell wall biosynthesis
VKITVIYSGVESSYLVGLVSGLSKSPDLEIDVIDSDRTIGKFDEFDNVNFLNYRGSLDHDSNTFAKVERILKYYCKLITYAYKTDSKLLHIQWMNKFFLIDRTLMNLYYKLMGKKLIFTAHNINAKKRNDKDTFVNKLSLKIHYNLVDHIIVHNKRMKDELVKEFGVKPEKVAINALGLNVNAPQIEVTKRDALSYVNLPENKKIILFFGGIVNYKGLHILLKAFNSMLDVSTDYHLLIAGAARDEEYYKEIEKLFSELNIDKHCTKHINFIDDKDIPYYFNAADCCVLPYTSIFQSGVHALSYAYGLPVIASDVGSFRDEDVIENETGYIFEPSNEEDLKQTLVKYFNSPLYNNLEQTRNHIKEWAQKKYSWDEIGKNTSKLYHQICKS